MNAFKNRQKINLPKKLKIGRNDECWCKSGKKYKVCHEEFDKRIDSFARQGAVVPDRSIIKTPEQIEKIKESAVINRACLDEVAKVIGPGMNTQEIDDIIVRVTKDAGAIAAPLNYGNFPKSVCTSVNEQVCHGIPSKDVVLKDGDIVNVDCSTILNGYYSDSSRMFCIGQISPEKQKLVDVTLECVKIGFENVKPWTFMGDMSEAIHNHAKDNGYTIVREIGGHGIGLEFHEDPWVSFTAKAGTQMLMVPGLMFTIEPMVNMGRQEIFTDPVNKWEVSTQDGKPSAQWEYQVVVTETGVELICW